MLEALALSALLITISYLVFSNSIGNHLVALRPYVIFPLLIWACVRFGLVGGTGAVLLIAVVTIWHTTRGAGPFVLPEETRTLGILGAQIFLAISEVSALALITLLEERRRDAATLSANEAALGHSEERLRLALDAGAMGTWDWDFATGAIVWSPQHATLLGMRPDEFDGRYETFARRIHPDDLPGLEAAIQEAIKRQAFYQHEYRVIWPDGTLRWVSGRGRTFANASGEPARMAGILMDITARREAQEREQTLAEERDRVLERLQLVLEQMPIGCILNDPDFNIIYWNPAATRIFGYGQAEVVGRPPSSYLVPTDLWPSVAMVQERVRAGQHVSGEARTLTKSGREILCEWQHTPLTDADGAFVGSLSVAEDVTARRADEQEIRRLNAELERRVAQRTAALESANRELEAFSYSVSHDLRAPLRHIDGFVNLLVRREDARLDQASRRYLRVIAEASTRMGVLIDDLLMLSRAGRTEFQPQPVDVGQVLCAVLDELAPATADRAISWDIRPLPVVLADPRLLRQVLTNLVGNAIKYTGTQPEPCITVAALEETDGQITFYVQDNGVGFDMQYASKLFGVFQRLHREDEFEGTGIGLAIVQRIVHRHGGRVWAEGQPGAGATFYVTLAAASRKE
jgi:PAS domain S-box-containing protein